MRTTGRLQRPPLATLHAVTCNPTKVSLSLSLSLSLSKGSSVRYTIQRAHTEGKKFYRASVWLEGSPQYTAHTALRLHCCGTRALGTIQVQTYAALRGTPLRCYFGTHLRRHSRPWYTLTLRFAPVVLLQVRPCAATVRAMELIRRPRLSSYNETIASLPSQTIPRLPSPVGGIKEEKGEPTTFSPLSLLYPTLRPPRRASLTGYRPQESDY